MASLATVGSTSFIWTTSSRLDQVSLKNRPIGHFGPLAVGPLGLDPMTFGRLRVQPLNACQMCRTFFNWNLFNLSSKKYVYSPTFLIDSKSRTNKKQVIDVANVVFAVVVFCSQ